MHVQAMQYLLKACMVICNVQTIDACTSMGCCTAYCKRESNFVTVLAIGSSNRAQVCTPKQCKRQSQKCPFSSLDGTKMCQYAASPRHFDLTVLLKDEMSQQSKIKNLLRECSSKSGALAAQY